MGPAPAPRYKLFISYAPADRTWARSALMPALGLPPESVITTQEFRFGANKVDEFERAVSQSEYTLLILTPAYMASEWTEYTESMAKQLSRETGRNLVIPLKLEACEAKLSVRQLTELDCTDPAAREEQLARLRDFLQVAQPTVEAIPCPYPGMTPFGATRAASFFGREKDVKDLAGLLQTGQRFLIVIGASGCGKSSLVFAGLVPRLEKEGGWLIRSLRPGATPMAELAKVLGAAGTDWASAANALLDKEERSRLLLVIDQLEEAFSLPKAEQAEFIAAIKSLKQSSRCVALMTMRADFFENLLGSDFSPLDDSQWKILSPLRGDSLREAIVKPAVNLGVYLEKGLIERLMTDVGDEPGALPALQETMVLLWGEMVGKLLTELSYRNLDSQAPGISVALSRRGQVALSELSPPQRIIAERVLVRLIQFGEGRADTRRRQPMDELRSAGDDPADFTRTIEQLANNRILTLDGAEKDRVRVDLAHECLIQGWPKLRGWIEKRRAAEIKRRILLAKAEEWIRLEKKGGLLDQVELDDANSWMKGTDAAELGVDRRVEELIEASQELVDAGQKLVEAGRKELWRQRLMWRLRYAAAAIALGVLLWIFVPQVIADQAHGLIQQSDKNAAIERALLAVRMRDTARTHEVLQEAVQAKENGRFPPDFDATGVAFDQGGNQIVGVSAAGEAFVVDVNQDVRDKPLPVKDSVGLSSVAFQPGGKSIAAATRTGTVIVWPLPPPPKEGTTAKVGHTKPATCIVYSPKGDLLVTGSEDFTIRILDAATLDLKQQPLQAKGRINRLAFSPDGKYLAAATAENQGGDDPDGDQRFTAKLWEVQSGKWVRDFEGHLREVTDVAFSPRGDRMVTASADGRLRIWDFPQDPRQATLRKELSHQGDQKADANWMANNAFSAVIFVDDGHVASAGSAQNFAEIWDIGAGKTTDRLLGHQKGIRSLAFSSAGKKPKLATAGADQRVRLFYLATPDLVARAKLLLSGK